MNQEDFEKGVGLISGIMNKVSGSSSKVANLLIGVMIVHALILIARAIFYKDLE